MNPVFKERIILSSSLKGNEFIKALASFGKPSLGLRIMSASDLAEYALTKSGIVCPLTFVKNIDLAALLYRRVREIGYFGKYSFKDIVNALSSLNNLRKCIAINEKNEIETNLKEDIFIRKNKAIKKFYNALIETLEENDLIDEIGLIRFAIENAKPMNDVSLGCYKQEKLSNLEIALLEKLSDGEYESSDITEPQKLSISSYNKTFGVDNEIEGILGYIYQNNIPFDECLIATTNPTITSRILKRYQAVLGFPLVIGVGDKVSNTNPGELYRLANEYKRSHYHVDYLLNLIKSKAFDVEKFKKDLQIPDDFTEINKDLPFSELVSFESIMTVVGNLKLGFGEVESNDNKLDNYLRLINRRLAENLGNKIYQKDGVIANYVKSIKEVYNQGLISFLTNYTLIRESELVVDNNALIKITTALEYEKKYGIDYNDIDKYISELVVSGRKAAPGSLYVTSINNALSCLRKYLFIVDLDSKSFPGSIKEDPLIFDDDYINFGVDKASTLEIEDNKRAYYALLNTANSLGVSIHLYYAFYNDTTLKEQNGSSILFETYKLENGANKTFDDFKNEFNNTSKKYNTIEFFDNDLFPLSIVGKENKKNILLIHHPIGEKEIKEVDASSLIGSRGLSASAIIAYNECPYKFFLEYLLRIPQTEKTDIYEIIPPNEYGSLVHGLLEDLDKTKTDKDSFLNKAKEAFDDYIITHTNNNKAMVDYYRDDFIDVMSNAYDMEETTKAALREVDIKCNHEESGLVIHGYPDKVIKQSDGAYRVIDYKTGKRVTHDVDDPGTMLQGAVYAYILEHCIKYQHMNIKVNDIEFRYLRSKSVVSTLQEGHDVSEYIDKLNTVLANLKESLEKSTFEKSKPSDCKVCFYKDVCGGNK